MAESGGQPWLRDKRWREGWVRDGVGMKALLLWIAGMIAGAVAGLYVKIAIGDGSLKAIMAATLTSVGAIMLFVWAVRITSQWIRFGCSRFEMITFPGVIGGHLVGIVYTKVKLPISDGFEVCLVCYKYAITYEDHLRIRRIVFWCQVQHLARGALGGDDRLTAIPVGFRIPRDCPPTSSGARYDKIRWKLDVRAKAPGLAYHTAFAVPVFVTAESDAPVDASIDPVAPYRAQR